MVKRAGDREALDRDGQAAAHATFRQCLSGIRLDLRRGEHGITEPESRRRDLEPWRRATSGSRAASASTGRRRGAGEPRRAAGPPSMPPMVETLVADISTRWPTGARVHHRPRRRSTGSTRSAPGSSTGPGTISARRASRPISSNASPEQRILLDEVAYRGFQQRSRVKHIRASSTSWSTSARASSEPAGTSSAAIASSASSSRR